MSRYFSVFEKLPSGVTLDLQGSALKVVGPKGSLSIDVHPELVFKKEDGGFSFLVKRENVNKSLLTPKEKSLVGTFFKLVRNMCKGVSGGFEKKLELQGVGYRIFAGESNQLQLQLGFSHDVNFALPDGIAASVKGSVLVISGIDKQLVGHVADRIKSHRSVEPYKGKGFRYELEKVFKKAGKSGKK